MLKRKKLAAIARKRISDAESEKVKHQKFIQSVLSKSRAKTKGAKLPAWQLAYAEGLKTNKDGLVSTSDKMDGVGSKKEIINPNLIKNLEKEDEALALREAAAQEEAIIKSKRVGMLYNKGNYQYLGSGKDIKDLGKKTSQL